MNNSENSGNSGNSNQIHIDKNNHCIDSNNNINFIKLIMAALSPVYFSNIIIFVSLLLYAIRANYLFYIIFPLLCINAIFGTIIVSLYWKKFGKKYLKNACYSNKEENTINLDYISRIYKKEILLVKLFAILSHWIPIFITHNLVNKYTLQIGPSYFMSWLIGLSLSAIYMIFNGHNYGKIPYHIYIAFYPIILLGVNCYLYSTK